MIHLSNSIKSTACFKTTFPKRQIFELWLFKKLKFDQKLFAHFVSWSSSATTPTKIKAQLNGMTRGKSITLLSKMSENV